MPQERDAIEDFPCLVAVLNGVALRDQEAVRRVLDDFGTPAEAVAAVLRSHGHRVSASTIRTYRRALRRAQEGGRA